MRLIHSLHHSTNRLQIKDPHYALHQPARHDYTASNITKRITMRPGEDAIFVGPRQPLPYCTSMADTAGGRVPPAWAKPMFNTPSLTTTV